MAVFKRKVIDWKGEVAIVNYVDKVLFSAILFLLFLSHEYCSNRGCI